MEGFLSPGRLRTSLPGTSRQVRKLEFLMAEAQLGGYDSVITIGGIQVWMLRESEEHMQVMIENTDEGLLSSLDHLAKGQVLR
jgi:hypothetical protein